MNMEYTLSGGDKRLVGEGEGEMSLLLTHTSVTYLSPAMIFSPPFHRHDGGEFKGHYESRVSHC